MKRRINNTLKAYREGFMVEEWIYQFLVGPREVCVLLLRLAGRIFGHYLFSPVVTFVKEGGVQEF
jgi:hypothetical protein